MILSQPVNERLININSQAPNIVVKESFSRIHGYYPLIPEYTFGDSRFDFYAESGRRPIYEEVKGVPKRRTTSSVFPTPPRKED